jgi:hypothetical protein
MPLSPGHAEQQKGHRGRIVATTLGGSKGADLHCEAEIVDSQPELWLRIVYSRQANPNSWQGPAGRVP